MQLHTFSVCVDMSTCANNGHFIASSLYINFWLSTHPWQFPWRHLASQYVKTRGWQGSRGYLVALESPRICICRENHSPVEQRQISFPHDIIRRSVTDVVLSFVGMPRHVFQYLTVWKVYKLAFVIFRRYWNGPQYMSCCPKSEWLLLIMAH